jgi:hypothetical protein
MKWLEVVRFELAHQLRRRSNWILYGLFLFPLIGVANNDLAEAGNRELLYNAPLFIGQAGLIMGLVGMLILAVVAGNAATRDVQTRMEPLMRATPVNRAAYLGGRFVGAFAVAALLAATVTLVRALIPLAQPELGADLVGPFRLAGYIQSYLLIMLPNAFVATAILFSLAAAVRHTIGSWVGAVLIFGGGQFSHSFFGDYLGRWDLATMFDPTGLNALDVMAQTWAPLELHQRLIGSEGLLLWNRALWLVLASGILLLTYKRLRSVGGSGGPSVHPIRPGAKLLPPTLPLRLEPCGSASRSPCPKLSVSSA